MAAKRWAARLTLTRCLQVQRPTQGLGWSSGDEDQAAGSPTDRTSAHSWPHTRTQAPVVLQQDRRGLAETGQGLPLEESPLGGLQLRPGALQRAMSRLAAATQMGALSSSVEGPPAATQRGELSSGMDRLAAATSRGGLMACFERVWTATSERQASTAEPQTRPDAAGRQHQQVSRWRMKDEGLKAINSGQTYVPLLPVACCMLSSETVLWHSGEIDTIPSAQDC